MSPKVFLLLYLVEPEPPVFGCHAAGSGQRVLFDRAADTNGRGVLRAQLPRAPGHDLC